jgi:hypothetical protein
MFMEDTPMTKTTVTVSKAPHGYCVQVAGRPPHVYPTLRAANKAANEARAILDKIDGGRRAFLLVEKDAHRRTHLGCDNFCPQYNAICDALAKIEGGTK